jgi:hypothetical protein
MSLLCLSSACGATMKRQLIVAVNGVIGRIKHLELALKKHSQEHGLKSAV